MRIARHWTDERLDHAIGVLAHCATVAEAAAKLGLPASTLSHAFTNAGRPTPATFLRHATPAPAGGGVSSSPIREAASSPDGGAELEPEFLTPLIALVNRRALPLLDVCDRLDASPGDVRAAVAWGQRHGYHVRAEGGIVCALLPIGAGAEVTVGDTTPGRKRVAIVTDVHFGSKHSATSELRAWLGSLPARGVEVVVVTGDVLDGHDPKLTMDQRAVSLEDQLAEAAAAFAGSPMHFVAITGNHDGYHSRANGVDCGRVTAERMRAAGLTWDYVGVCEGHAIVHGARWQLWHPHGGAGTRNAVRRVLNDRAEAHRNEGKPPLQVLALGHFHKHVSFTAYPERTFCVAGGCWQRKGSEFANRITREWDVGGTIVSYTVDDAGAASEFAAEFYAV